MANVINMSKNQKISMTKEDGTAIKNFFIINSCRHGKHPRRRSSSARVRRRSGVLSWLLRAAGSFSLSAPAALAGGIIHEGRPPWQIPGIGGNR